MGDKTGDVAGRVGALEDQLKKLNYALYVEETERKKAEAEFQKQLQDVGALIMDNNNTAGYVIRYLNQLDAQYHAKTLMLQEQIQTFNNFLNLPEKSNKWGLIWDAAWAILANTVPGLRLTSTFAKIEEKAKTAMTLAKKYENVTPKLSAKIVTAAGVGHNVADFIKKGNDIRSKVRDATSLVRACRRIRVGHQFGN
jgi:hypothetical protein